MASVMIQGENGRPLPAVLPEDTAIDVGVLAPCPYCCTLIQQPEEENPRDVRCLGCGRYLEVTWTESSVHVEVVRGPA